MKHILVGEEAVNLFENQEWNEFEDTILENFNGDIIGWDEKEDKLSTLLEMLSGWSDFMELLPEDLETIKKNTRIEF